MSKKTRISLITGIIVVLIIAAVIICISIFGISSDSAVAPVSGQPVIENSEPSASVENDNPSQDDQTESSLSKAQADEIINKIAKERFGQDSFVIFLSTEGPSEVEIEGIKRKVYIYAADSVSAHDSSGDIRGLYHIDTRTGEVFDNGSGTMEKIIFGE